VLLLLAVAAAIPLQGTDPATLTPWPGPDLGPPLHLRAVQAEFLAWTWYGHDFLALDESGFAVRDVSGARRVEKPCPAWEPGTRPVDAASSRDLSTQAVLLEDGRVCVWAGGLPPLPLGKGDWTAIELADGASLAVGRSDGTVEVRELPTGKVRWRRNVGIGGINDLAVDANGTRLYASGDKRGGAVFQMSTGRLIHTVGREPASAIMVDPIHDAVWLGRADGRLERYDEATWRRTGSWALGAGAVVDLDLSLEGDLVLAGRDDGGKGRYEAFDLVREEIVFQVSASGAGRAGFRFAPGSAIAVGTSGDGVTHLWRRPAPPTIPSTARNLEPPRLRTLSESLDPGDLPAAPTTPARGPDPLLSPDARRALTVEGGALRLDGAVVSGSDGAQDRVWAPDGSRFAAWVPGELRVWTAEGALERRYPMERPRAVALDAGRVLVAAADGSVRLASSGGIRTLRGVTGATAVALDPANPNRVGVGTQSGEVRVVKLENIGSGAGSAIFPGAVVALAFSPDGRRLAAAGPRAAGQGGRVVLLEESTSDTMVEAGGQGPTRTMLRVGEIPRRLRFLDRSLLLVEEPHAVRVIDAGDAGERLAAPLDLASAGWADGKVHAADRTGRVRELSVAAKSLPWTTTGRTVALSGDSRRAASVDGDTVTIWNAIDGSRSIELPPADVPIASVSFDRLGRYLAVVTVDGVEVYDAVVKEVAGHTDGPAEGTPAWAHFSYDGRWIWTWGGPDTLVAYAWEDGTEQERVAVPAGSTVDERRSLGRFLAVVGPGGTTWVDTEPEARRRVWEAGKPRPLAVADGGAALVQVDGGVARMDVATGVQLGRAYTWEGAPAGDAAAFSLDGTRIAVADTEGVIRVIEVDTRKLYRALAADAPPRGSVELAPVIHLAFDGTGALLASFDAEGRRRTWDWGTSFDRGYELPVPGPVLPVDRVSLLVPDPDGRRVWVGYGDGTVRAWDVQTGKNVQLFRAHVAEVSALALSSDGGSVVSGGADGVVRVFTRDAQVEEAAFSTLGVPVDAVGREGDTVWARCRDGVVRSWDLRRKRRTGRWQGPAVPAAPAPAPSPTAQFAAVFSPVSAEVVVGGRVVTAHADGRLRLWDPGSQSLLAELTAFSDGAWVVERADGVRVASESLRDRSSPLLFGGGWEGISP